MNRSRFIFLTDLMLIPVFVLSFYTGIELHLAEHGIGHETWHNWAVFHTIASLLFMILVGIHVKSHWGWYKGLKTIGCKGKRKIVLILSVIFALTVVSGLSLLLFVDGANSSIGLLHYKVGIVTGVLGVLHILKRKQILYKGVSSHVFGKKKRKIETSFITKTKSGIQ